MTTAQAVGLQVSREGFHRRTLNGGTMELVQLGLVGDGSHGVARIIKL